MNSKTIDKIVDFLRISGLYVSTSLMMLLIITAILFIFKINISIFHFPISLAISLIINYLLIRKKINPRLYLMSIIFSILVIVSCIHISGKIYDQTYDGNSYHKSAVSYLKEGWNPLYESSSTFSEKMFENEKLIGTHAIWHNHYPKAVWYISANFYILTDNIETGKSVNLLIIYSIFTLLLSYTYSKFKNILISFLLSLACVITPITIVQILNYYNDGLLGTTLFGLIAAMIMFYDEKCTYDKNEVYLWIASLIIIIVNIKFTGLGLAGLYCLGIYILYVKNKVKNNLVKEIIKPTIIFSMITICAIFVVGSTSYVKNTIDHGHPFYPLFGKNKVDIITLLQPKSFENMNHIKKFFISNFSKSDNIYVATGREPKLKLPFTYSEDEKYWLSVPDLRIGGFGLLFSGIFIVSIIICLISLIQLFKKNKQMFEVFSVILGVTIITIILISECWWARYAPQVYLFPLLSIVFLSYFISKNNTIIKNILLYGFISLVFINIGFFIYNNIIPSLKKSVIIHRNLQEIKNSNNEIIIVITEKNFTGVLANINDLDIKYKVEVDSSGNNKLLYDSFLQYKTIDK